MKQPDGSFVISGEKMWITNGGFADVFVVFAKVDGEHFTAFIVERKWPGVSSGKEEHKLGLHGSSTTPVILQEVKVPADAVLGEIGKGHKVAFNVLNFGRFKLGAMCSGGARRAIGEAAKYAAARKQFGVPIATFGAIKHKLGEMTARQYALESMMYRTAGLIDQRIEATPDKKADNPAPMLQALEEFAVEASIAKVLGSETIDYIIDENLQIHGGNGYVRDYPAERHYRDARVNRIFEGTNEINRLLIPGMLMKKALKGELPLMAAAKALQDEIMSPSMSVPDEGDGVLTAESRACITFKKVVLMVAGTAMQRFGTKLEQEQEVLSYLADILIDTYATESAVLRAKAAVTGKAVERGAAPGCGERHGERSRRPHRAGGPQCIGGDGRWRCVADAAGRASPPAEDHAGEYGDHAAQAGGCHGRQGWLYLLALKKIGGFHHELPIFPSENIGRQPGLRQVVIDDINVAAGPVDEVEADVVRHLVGQRVVLREAANRHPRRERVVQPQHREVHQEIAPRHLDVVAVVLHFGRELARRPDAAGGGEVQPGAVIELHRRHGDALVEALPRAAVHREVPLVHVVLAGGNDHVRPESGTARRARPASSGRTR